MGHFPSSTSKSRTPFPQWFSTFQKTKFLVPYSIWNSRSLVGWSVSPSVRQYVCMSPPWCRHLPLRCRHRCRHPHWVSTPSLCRCRHQCQHQHFSGISVLSTYSYHPFISTTIYPKILSNLLNLSCYMELFRIYFN